jgi:hypothetical protein
MPAPDAKLNADLPQETVFSLLEALYEQDIEVNDAIDLLHDPNTSYVVEEVKSWTD